MELERALSRYVCDAKYEDLPQAPIQTMKNVVLTVLGTTLGGATAEGCGAVVDQVKTWGGREDQQGYTLEWN